MIKQSLILRVLAICFTVLAIPLLIVSFIFFQLGYEEKLVNAKKDLLHTALGKTGYLEQIKPFSKAFASEIAYFLNLKDSFPTEPSEKLNQELKRLVALTPGGEFVTIKLVGKEIAPSAFGIIASSEAQEVNHRFYSSVILKEFTHGGTSDFFLYYYSNIEKKGGVIASVAHGIVKNGVTLGFLVVTGSIEKEVDEIFKFGAALRPDVRYLVIQRDSIIVKAEDPSLVGNYFFPLDPKREDVIAHEVTADPSIKLAAEPLQVTWQKNTPFFEFVLHGDVQIGAYTDPKVHGLSFVAYAPKKAIFNKAMKGFLIIYNGYGLIILLGAWISYWLSEKLSRPLHQLHTLMENVGKGDLQGRFKPMPLGSEINELGKLFNATLDDIIFHIQKGEDYRVQKEMYYKELEIGYTVQRQLSPEKMPQIPGIDLHAFYLPAEIVGGDFHDVLEKEEKVIFIVADTSTMRGISTCLYGLSMRSLLRSFSMIYPEVTTVLNNANELFCEDAGASGVYENVALAFYNLKEKTFTYATCGSILGFILNEWGVSELKQLNIALGLKKETNFSSETVELKEGDTILFFTIGILSHFTKATLIDFLREHRDLSSSQLSAKIKDLFEHEPRHDEATMLSISLQKKGTSV